MNASATIDIARPIAEVFAYIADPQNMERWVVGVSDVRLRSDDPTTEGARFESTYTYGGGTHEMAYEVTVAEAPVRYAIRGDGPFPFSGVIDLMETPTGTRVTNTIDAAADGLLTTVTFTLFRPVMRRVMAKRLREELLELQSALETPVTAETID